MTRKVHNSAMVAHLWAAQSQDEACNSGRSMRFSGDTLYSYSTPIGRLVKDTAGETVALITCESYSATTGGKHKSAAFDACRHMPLFFVPALGAEGGWHREPGGDMHAANLTYLAGMYADYAARLMRAQSRPYSFESRRKLVAAAELTGRADLARNYAARFALAPPVIDTAADIARITARHDRLDAMRADPKYAAKREKERETREARRIASEARKMAAWRAGEIHWLPYGMTGDHAALRVRGDTVETSRGASVPADDARRAVLFIAARRNAGKAWQRNGEQFPVGDFQLDSISAGGDVRAGCHKILWGEIVSIAGQLNMGAL